MAGTDVLQEARDLISSRLTDLDDERKRLESALKELGGKVAKRKPGRPRGSKAPAAPKASTGNGRRGRGRGRGGVTQEVKLLRLAKTNPESDNQAIADHLGVKLSTATAFMAKTKSKGLITRENKRLVVTEAGQAMLDGQPKPSAAKPAPAKTSKKAPAKKQAKRKKASTKKAAKKSAAKAPKAKASTSASAPAAPGNSAGAKAADKSGDKPGGADEKGKDGSGSGNVLYDK